MVFERSDQARVYYLKCLKLASVNQKFKKGYIQCINKVINVCFNFISGCLTRYVG